MTPERHQQIGELAPGTLLGPYEIVALIGAGGMGEVYKALDKRLNRAVAVKVLPAQFSENPEMKERFERETKTVAALSHPNILAIFDIGTDQGIHYAVTELLEGETLRSVIDRGPLPWRRAVEIAMAVAEGLSAAHSKGMIHRDVKPENIFVTGDGRVKVLDFGVALWTPAASAALATEMPTATAPGMVLGTFGYMSPEQVRGESATAASDVFSLGCVLYEMVSGRRAFTRPTVAETIAAVLKEELPMLETTHSEELSRVIERCLKKNVILRFQSATDLASNLKSLLSVELLEGESLEDRISRGPLQLPLTIQTALNILMSLQALHHKGLVHGNLQPSNIVLTQRGVNLQQGDRAGAPNYMAPEQLEGKNLDHRADLFVMGALLFEMLTGRKAFSAKNSTDLIQAVLREQPPALTGSAAISAVDLVVQRAMAKTPDARYNSALSMADDLRAAMLREDPAVPAQARVVRRLIVLPFRMLRPDSEIDFLAFSLPDAITNSLFGLTSLVVRSSLTAAKYVGLAPDLKVIAVEAAVDVVLTGTLLRSGDQLRVSAQLAEAPGGTVLWSETSQLSLKEIFQLQDEIVQRVVKSLELPLTGRESRLLKHDVPANPTAYEFYLRANELSTDWAQTIHARDLYLSCVSQDPNYAPAWARLGRCHLVISKYGGDAGGFSRAEEAFRRALELNPDLTLAHNFLASLEADLGRVEKAMQRLLERARMNRSDPNLFSGLVYVCRFCGLLDASMVAHQHARRLDPQIPTSVNQSYFMSGDYRQALETSGRDFGYMNALALASLGRENEALDLLRHYEQRPAQHQLMRYFIASLRALLEGKREESVSATEECIAVIQKGGEELFYCVRQLAYLGELDRAIAELERAVDLGFFCYAVMLRDPWLDALRRDSRFVKILNRAQSRYEAARKTFLEAGGAEILGAV